MSKHTPGPWVWTEYDADNNAMAALKNSGNQHICDFGSDATYYNSCGSEPSSTDKLLIAAAPDLLAALIGLDEAFCSLNDNMTREKRHDARLKLIAARAAVAKATGKEPA